MAIYHYSPRTGKPENCKASKPENCPFNGYVHSEDINEIQRFADVENEGRAKAPDNLQNLLNVDWSVSSQKPYVLTSDTVDSSKKITYKALKDMGLPEELQEIIRGKPFAVFPKTKEGIREFFDDNYFSRELFGDLKDAFNDGLYQKVPIQYSNNVGPYERWDVLENINSAPEPWMQMMDKPILGKNPRGKLSFTAVDVWNDYFTLKGKRNQASTFQYGDKEFFLLSHNVGINRDEENYLSDFK